MIVCFSDLIYDFLIMLSKRLTEVDVSTILTILQCMYGVINTLSLVLFLLACLMCLLTRYVRCDFLGIL